ncbi:MAG: exonuclease SbcCD subunit D [Acidobacteria bacterium]|nr:exonuclease SbcCD subunit D [Acidobacteriota bacterium]
MTKFIHTADLQLGMTRHFLEGDAQPRYTQARFDVIRQIGDLATAEGCDFVIVAGDVFESNLLDRRTVIRSLDAMSAIHVPVYLLPGNHDPLNASSIFRSETFLNNSPPNVTVLETSEPVRLSDLNVEIVGAPWDSKEPLEDLVTRACQGLGREPGLLRIVVGHGAVDTLTPDLGNPAIIHVEDVEAFIASGAVQYVGLGDRHSLTRVGESGRFWYSGSPLATDYPETQPNHVLIVELDNEGIEVTPHLVGNWHFERQNFELNGDDDVTALEQWFDEFSDKQRTVVKLNLVGTLSISCAARLETVLEHKTQLFAAIERSERASDLHVMPDDDDLGALSVSGFARGAYEELLNAAKGDTPDAEEARDALGLLFRLSGGAR